jgi:hypothetical protein
VVRATSKRGGGDTEIPSSFFLCTSRELAPEKSEQTSSNTHVRAQTHGFKTYIMFYAMHRHNDEENLSITYKKACDFDHSPQENVGGSKKKKERRKRKSSCSSSSSRAGKKKNSYFSYIIQRHTWYTPIFALLFLLQKDMSTLHNLQRDGFRKQSCKRQQIDNYSKGIGRKKKKREREKERD